jgi:cell division protein FtsQ
MARSVAGRPGRSSPPGWVPPSIARSFAAAPPRAVAWLPFPRAAQRPRGGSPGLAAGARSTAAGLAGGPLRLLARHRRVRLALLAGLASLPLLAGGWLALRHSSLVAVQRVRVSGVHGAEAQAIEAALTGAARHMSTLDVNVGALRADVAPYGVVRDVRASASFPHGLSIDVTEQLPVAALAVGGTRTAVAADGVVLGPALLSSTLPTVAASVEPATGQSVKDAGLLAALTVLGAAPAPLAGVVARVYSGPNGLTVAMRSGLLAYFGDASRPRAKWLSLARVLADTSSAGASYVDVRLPERPAAGFPSGTPPMASSAAGAGTPSQATTAGERVSASEATVAALAAGLGGASGGAPASGREAASGSPAGASGASGSSEASTTSGSEASAPGSSEASASGSSEAETPASESHAVAPTKGG